MKNLSIRAKILATVVVVNLVGAAVVSLYMHQTYSKSLDVSGTRSIGLGLNAWEQLDAARGSVPAIGDVAAELKQLEAMKKISGADYGLLITKSLLNQAAYDKAQQTAGKAGGWGDREEYVLVASTDDALSEKMQIRATADSVPDTGKLVGIENGACSQTCHEGVKGKGDFWTVSWSTDSRSRAHAVFPVLDAQGKVAGLVYSIEDISAQADSARGSMMSTLTVIGITLLIATLTIGGLLDMLVFRRLNKMILSMEDLSVRVAGGDYDSHFKPDGSNDEIGRFEAFFARFTDLVSTTLKMLTPS